MRFAARFVCGVGDAAPLLWGKVYHCLLYTSGTQCQKPFVCAGIIARGIKRALGHFIQVFLLCRIIGKVHILVKVEHIAIAFARGNCINCHDLVVLAAVQAVQLNDRVFLDVYKRQAGCSSARW